MAGQGLRRSQLVSSPELLPAAALALVSGLGGVAESGAGGSPGQRKGIVGEGDIRWSGIRFGDLLAE